ncbi:MAG: 16S rRNA (adenine(1518)-N(6)/adenine(1519)-N(6))-dimethyltransferase RsmA [Myxococcales bacterium]|nr:16S rRNA (adenine(1518)-N(6)/adenine(1519)-N(6))-dimethyltransferase RsmA [Myxococcales bacterium]
MADNSPKELLKRYGLKAKESWGQNFLSDEVVLSRIVDEAMLVESDVVVELGPGLGHLTRALLETGCTLTAVERDRDMVKVLTSMELPGLTLVEGNAADIDFAKAAKADQVIVVGNLPYHLTSSILFQVLDQADHVRRAVFTLQAEVVERLAAEPGGRDYGLLSVLLNLRFHVEEVMKIPSHFFHPPPKVNSAVVRLSRREKPRAEVINEARFRQLVKSSFAQRRKTLSNSIASDKALAETYELGAALVTAGIDGKRRAETLSVEEFAAIERALGPVKV